METTALPLRLAAIASKQIFCRCLSDSFAEQETVFTDRLKLGSRRAGTDRPSALKSR
jgi:hypothetical protein